MNLKSVFILALVFQIQAFAGEVIISNITVRSANATGALRGQIEGDLVKSGSGTVEYTNLVLKTSNGKSYFLLDPEVRQAWILFVDEFICRRIAPTTRFSQSYPLSNKVVRGQAVSLLEDGSAVIVDETKFEAYSLRMGVSCSQKPQTHIGE